MPIRPENKHRYPTNWQAIRARILSRAGNRCEQCGVPNGATVERYGKLAVIVLTVAHLDHTPENCADENLRAWCQRCHNTYDAPMRRAGITERARAARAAGDPFVRWGASPGRAPPGQNREGNDND